MRFEDDIRAHKEEVTMVKFLNPLPLLMTGDSTGCMYIWHVKNQVNDTRQCLIRLKSLTMEESVPVTAVDSYYNENEKGEIEFILLIGDEKGCIKVWDLSYIPKNFENIKPIDFSN